MTYSMRDYQLDQLDRAVETKAAAEAALATARSALYAQIGYARDVGVPVARIAAQAGITRSMAHRLLRRRTRPLNPDDF